MLLVAGLVWPPQCVAYGELYRSAAVIRDTGRPLKDVIEDTQDQRVRLMLIQVYDRNDMSPTDWYWFAIGVCTGLRDEPNKVGVRYGPNARL